jgi:hypothetical protein
MRSEPLMRVGAGFGLNRYSSVSSAVVRVKIKLQNDRKFKGRVEWIKNNILKGQTKTPKFCQVASRPGTETLPQYLCIRVFFWKCELSIANLNF